MSLRSQSKSPLRRAIRAAFHGWCIMKLGSPIVAFAAFALLLPSAFAKDITKNRNDTDAANDIKQAPKITYFHPEESVSHGLVTIGGNNVDYDAIAGTLVVHPKGWDDAPQTQAEQEE